jgi:hypothetical protein
VPDGTGMEVEPELELPGGKAGTFRKPSTTSPAPSVASVERSKRVTVGGAGPVPA